MKQPTATIQVTTIDCLRDRPHICRLQSHREGEETVLTLVREGILDYVSFERDVESVEIHGDVAVLMGLETVKPKGKAPFAGQTVRRRFTNVWMKRDGRWQFTARQATIIGHE